MRRASYGEGEESIGGGDNWRGACREAGGLGCGRDGGEEGEPGTLSHEHASLIKAWNTLRGR